MQKEWKAFKVTSLLYFSILLISLGFYQLVVSLKELQKDIKILQKTVSINNELMYFPYSKNIKKEPLVDNINKEIAEVTTWFSLEKAKQQDTKASERFSQLLSCWDMNTKNLLEEEVFIPNKDHHSCHNTMKLSMFMNNEAIEVKQKQMMNRLYIGFLTLILVMLLLIYTIRLYIHQQMKKHAIHDHETKLFNKQYFCAELKTSCARAVRNNAPLSLLSISIDDFGKESKHYSQKMQAYLLKSFGGLITSLIRESDVACRYDENHFSILLPDTSEENALILEKRVRETLERHDFGAIPELNFKFATAHLHYKETPEAFMGRIETLLK